jgi:hypothetical protein
MGGLIQFVQNYQDLSTDKGFQFKFFCDHCHNGFMTRFQTSAFGIAESALQVAGNLFGGVFRSASSSAYEVQRAIGGRAHDAALEEAVREAKGHFQQCSKCGQWVCPDVCWNAQANLCVRCAPNFDVSMAAEHAQAKVNAARQQLQDKAQHSDYVNEVDMGAKAVMAAPPRATADASRCGTCGGAMADGVRFCSQCGTPRVETRCPGCGADLAPNAKFCGQCGTRIG